MTITLGNVLVLEYNSIRFSPRDLVDCIQTYCSPLTFSSKWFKALLLAWQAESAFLRLSDTACVSRALFLVCYVRESAFLH